MAIEHVRTMVHNPAKGRKGRKKKMARRNLSRAQIKAGFGGARRKAALKNRPARPAKKRNHAKKRNAPARHAHSQKTPFFRPAPRKAKAKARKNRSRKNTGELVHLTLGSPNPARKGKMAQIKKSHSHRPKHRAGTRKGKKNTGKRRMHRNPFGAGWGAEITSALFVIGGAVSSKIAAQLVLGASNTGPMGYAANLAAGGLGAWIIGGPMKDKKAAAAFFSGSVVEVVLRLITDYTPFGSYVSGLGMGDYFMSNWVTPQRYTDALNSAQVQIPSGWAPTTVIASAAAPAGTGGAGSGMSGLYSGMSESLY
jgi:hypothetical protein